MGFWSRLARPVVNVTLASPSADGATRQRQNLGAARIAGIEATWVRAFGTQYEHDRNVLPMPGYLVVGVSFARQVTRNLEAFVVAENLLDRAYLVGRAGVDTLGSPRMIRAGLRLRFAR